MKTDVEVKLEPLTMLFGPNAAGKSNFLDALQLLSRIEVEVNDLGEVELRLNERGVKMPARLLSEGTLRLLGLLALTGDPPALVGLRSRRPASIPAGSR